MDAPEAPNGIACSGGMAATDPLCAEQFKNSAVAALKVSPEPGFVFTGWTVNGGQVKTASADTLFLSAMPVLAGDIVPIPTGTADCQATCSKVTITAPTTVKRDEIFDVTLTLDPPPLTSWNQPTVTFDLEGQKTENLPGRGEVQMYDFGYDRNNDGKIDPGQTSYTFNPLLDGGTKTIKAVYNRALPPPQGISIAASLGGYTFQSEPIAVMYQIRKYTIEGNSKTNDYDESDDPIAQLNTIKYWVDYWQHWHYPDEQNPYIFKMFQGKIEHPFDYELIKAICYKESTMLSAYYVATYPNDKQNIMQCKPDCRSGLSSGSPRDVNWGTFPIANDSTHGDLYPFVPTTSGLEYTDVDVDEVGKSIKWGIRWLYLKRSDYDYYPDNSTSTSYAYNLKWFDWKTTLKNYRGSNSSTTNENYANFVLAIYQNGENPAYPEEGFKYLWPIMTNGYAR